MAFRKKSATPPAPPPPPRTLFEKIWDSHVVHRQDDGTCVIWHRARHRPGAGLTLPGMTIVCGDSHTSTHGAFGALAFGIGTSEVEHVLATQTLIQKPAKNMRDLGRGRAAAGVTAKDVILAIIGKIGTAGGTGYVIEYAGSRDPRPVDGRPHDGLQHVDRGGRARRPDRAGRHDLPVPRRAVPTRRRAEAWDGGQPVAPPAVDDKGAHFDARSTSTPRTSADGDLGHQPAGRAADHRRRARPGQRAGREPPRGLTRALAYMGLTPGTRLTTCRSTACSSAPAPTAASRTCAPPPRSRAAARWRRRCRPWSCRAPAWSRPGREGRARQDLPRGRLRMARSRAARCASRMKRRGHRPRTASRAAALRLDLQPQFRRVPPGPGGPHAPHQRS
jgi:hypothetical protein